MLNRKISTSKKLYQPGQLVFPMLLFCLVGCGTVSIRPARLYVPIPNTREALRSCISSVHKYFPSLLKVSDDYLLTTWVSGDRSGNPVQRQLRITARHKGAGTELGIRVELRKLGVTPFTRPCWVPGGIDRQFEDELAARLASQLIPPN